MKERLASLRSDLGRRVAPALRSLAAHRFWLECGAVTFFALLAAISVGRGALERAERLQQETRRLERVRAGVDRWVAQVQPALPAESLLWRESAESIRKAMGEGGGGLAVAYRVARRAEEVGIPDVSVRLVEPDSLPEAAEMVGDVPAVMVDFEGDWASVLNFLGVLPPPLTVVDLSVSRRGGLLHARALVVGGPEEGG